MGKMKHTAHTPGPWEIEGSGSVLRTKTGVNDRGGMMGGILVAQFFHPHGPNEADAALIAAAPDLLDAARLALNYIENTEGELGITLASGDALRAALSKAEGRSLSSASGQEADHG